MDLKHIAKMLEDDQGITMMRMEVLIEKYALAPVGLSSINVKILMVLMMKKRASQKEIVDYVLTTPANISRRLEKMERDGLIKRNVEGDKNDRRKVLISLTKKGETKFVEAIKRYAVIRHFMQTKFTKKEQEQQKKMMQKMKVVVDELEQKIENFY
jgi:DNA-binding MarR family transcriptional regulator